MIILKKITSCLLLFLLVICVQSFGYAQPSFSFEKGQHKDKISFQLVNNLVIIPVELNGVQLSFLLDTGVKNTILFSLTEADSISIKNVKPVKLRGIGGELVEGLKSNGNRFLVGDAKDINHSVYVVFDEALDFSSRMGVPIHGILGYDFYKDFVVETNYIKKRITFYEPSYYKEKRCKKCKKIPLEFYKEKPYMYAETSLDSGANTSLFLIDSGSSDAIWLFEDQGFITEAPKNYFEDFLGLTISGSLYGKRSKLDWFEMDEFKFEDVTVAFPNISSRDSLNIAKNRAGSIGGSLLKRFTVTMNYTEKWMLLKKNSNYKKPFYYNLSGLTLAYDGSLQVKELQDVRSEKLSVDIGRKGQNRRLNSVLIDPVFKFFTAPKIVIVELRENSPAALAGLEVGDGIIKINNVFSYKYKLHEVIALLSSKEGRKITIEYERGFNVLKTSFKLQKVL